MPTINMDKINERKTKIAAQLSAAIKANDETAMQAAMTDFAKFVAENITEQFTESASVVDSAILAGRGIRQLTSKERAYYEKMIAAGKAENPKMAIAGITDAFPITIIDDVVGNVKKSHPLLDLIDMKDTSAVVRIIRNKKGKQLGVWGELTSAIAGEVSGAIEVVDSTLLKLTAFIYVPKDLLDYGPEWVDAYVREILTEVISVTFETAVVDGDGDKKPIGMTRDISATASVVANKQPKKTAVKVTSLDAVAYGKLLAMMAKDDLGEPRNIENVILIVNPFDYCEKIMPATTVRGTDGTYRNNVLPYPTTVIQSVALNSGEAVIGLAKEYLACVGAGKKGKLDYDDSYKFVEDLRTYIMKLTAYGKASDDNAFKLLDISELEPAVIEVEVKNTVKTTTTVEGTVTTAAGE